MLVSPNKKLITYSTNISTPIVSNGTGQIVLTPPAGYLMKITGLYLGSGAVSGSSSGTDSFVIMGGTTIIATVTQSYGGNLMVSGLIPYTGEFTTMWPTTEGGFQRNVGDHVFDNSHSLTIQYSNQTNVTDSGTRNYTVYYTLEPETVF